ncbi:MAG: hypothetical protein L6R38_005052 [Xanthoria sp. 2 TBL-2021]|nr:MAG: hypothetical protein L6R38_005052 [Xanthoria sp. 2 TBL-2021]
MPSATSPPRSILKGPSAVTKDSPAPSNISREDRNRQLALHHAHLIQYRKDIESLIQTSIENLLELPTSSTASPSEPSDVDRLTVKKALRPFQPSDYDSLIEERNINHKCGHIFCRKENRKQNKRSKYRIVTGRDFRVVESKELEKWCGDECGRMALYLRVQLSEEPAWTREWEAGEPLELYSEGARASEIPKSSPPVSQPMMEPDGLDAKDTMITRMKDLAIERGDKDDTVKASTRVAVDVKENIHTEQVTPVAPNAESTNADAIEGYIPIGKHLSEWTAGGREEDEDLMPTI